MSEISYNKLIRELKKNNVYMLIGNGAKNQFKHIGTLKKTISEIIKNIPIGSNFLYFGDYPDKKKPDIGYAFKLLSTMRKDINIYMIQILDAKSWGVPDFVKGVFWHNSYTQKCKWGGLNNKNIPCSNTLKWVKINQKIPSGITKIFILGGGNITMDEFSLIKKYNIPYKYFIIERRYLNDGKTKTKKKDSLNTKIGITQSLSK